MARITINGVSLDPVAQSAVLRSAGLFNADASGSNYILIQTDGPLSVERKQQLADLGVTVLEYVPQNTYLCGYQSNDLDAIRGLPFVVWADVYFRAFKLEPSLLQARDTSATYTISTPGDVPVSPSRKLREVDVVFHDDVDPNEAQLKDRVSAAVGRAASALQPGRRKVRLVVEEGQLSDLASLDEVHHVEEVPKRQLFNDVARSILHGDVSIGAVAFEGAGEVVAVADTGFDLGSTQDVHPAFAGRVGKLYALGRGGTNDSSDPNGHGTHVAGSAVGDGSSVTIGGAIRGTAPKATLVLQSVLDPAGGLAGLPVDLHDLFEPAYRDDTARVHTNSWGAMLPGLPYDASAREIDDFIWNHPDLIVCFAAGNDGRDGNANGAVDGGSIGSQSAAKNCITVGASESDRPGFKPPYGLYWPAQFPVDPLASDHQADQPDGMAAFSSRGPTKEHRIKPDLVAPGTCVLSTRSRALLSAPSTFGVSADPLYWFLSGTSMATPLVAGCAAVVREFLVKSAGVPGPSAAIVKAMLINGAVDVVGQYSPSEAGPSPNNNSGFGRVHLAGSVTAGGENVQGIFGEGGPLQQGDEEVMTLQVPDRSTREVAGATLKATLVWSDPPGSALQNDLDLIVRTADGQERHGNMGLSQAFDRENNVEQVVWSSVPVGQIDIVIRAFRITQHPQPFAYVVKVF